MANNKLLEYGGEANVLLRAICNFDVNNNHYEEGDIVLYLTNVHFEFGYGNINSNAVIRKENILAYGERKINSVIINTESLQTKYLGLFTELKYTEINKTEIENINISDTGEFYTIKPISEDSLFIDSFEYGRLQIEMLDADNNCYKIIEFEDEYIGDMTVAYYSKVELNIYDVNKNCSLPYFSMEISTVGNIDKLDGNIYMKIGKVSLLTEPEFSVAGNINQQNLIFSIIKDEVLFGEF